MSSLFLISFHVTRSLSRASLIFITYLLDLDTLTWLAPREWRTQSQHRIKFAVSSRNEKEKNFFLLLSFFFPKSELSIFFSPTDKIAIAWSEAGNESLSVVNVVWMVNVARECCHSINFARICTMFLLMKSASFKLGNFNVFEPSPHAHRSAHASIR